MLILDRRMLLQAGSAAVGAAALAPTVPALARARWKLKVRLRGSEIRKIIMNLCNLPSILSKGTILILSSSIAVYAADSFSDADKAFVAKVSQGGMYEVELGKVAETKAVAQDVKDQGNTEAHDHTLVGEKLKSIVEANGMEFPKQLNTEFQARLDKIGALPADKFDAAYIEDMKKIHAADGAAFAKEATSGTNPDLKAFAAETYRIVQRHLGELGAKVSPPR